MNSVLIVDDSKIIRDLLEKIFSNMFFKVFVAEDGEEAIELYKEHRPNLVLLDYQLPIIDGVDVMHKIRALREENEQPKIIFCSSLSSINVLESAINAGCDDYIIKPLDEEIIATKLKVLGVI